VFFGSAAQGVGIDALLAGVDELLSSARGDPDAAVSGRVFKIERTTSGERVAYVRLFDGTLRPRQRVRVGGGEEAKPTSVKVFAPTGAPRSEVFVAGEMAASAAWAPSGSATPSASRRRPGETARFPRPALEAVVFPIRPEERAACGRRWASSRSRIR
jgi:ribosomal protection tetracycline resistance protein